MTPETYALWKGETHEMKDLSPQDMYDAMVRAWELLRTEGKERPESMRVVCRAEYEWITKHFGRWQMKDWECSGTFDLEKYMRELKEKRIQEAWDRTFGKKPLEEIQPEESK